jgi:hypothetical protein
MKAAGMLCFGRWVRRLVPTGTHQKGSAPRIAEIWNTGLGAGSAWWEGANDLPLKSRGGVLFDHSRDRHSIFLQGQDGRKGVLGHEEGRKGDEMSQPPSRRWQPTVQTNHFVNPHAPDFSLRREIRARYWMPGTRRARRRFTGPPARTWAGASRNCGDKGPACKRTSEALSEI